MGKKFEVTLVHVHYTSRCMHYFPNSSFPSLGYRRKPWTKFSMSHQSSQDVFLLCFVDDERLLWLHFINAITFDHEENIRFPRDHLQSHTSILARADPDLVVSFSPLRNRRARRYLRTLLTSDDVLSCTCRRALYLLLPPAPHPGIALYARTRALLPRLFLCRSAARTVTVREACVF